MKKGKGNERTNERCDDNDISSRKGEEELAHADLDGDIGCGLYCIIFLLRGFSWLAFRSRKILQLDQEATLHGRPSGVLLPPPSSFL